MCSFILFSIDLTDWHTDVAQCVSTEPSAQYSVLTRAWDDNFGNRTLELIIVVDELYAVAIMEMALTAMVTAKNKFKFQPKYKVIPKSQFQQGNLVLFSCHPAHFYSLYLSKADEKVLREAVTTLPGDLRPFPVGDNIAKKYPKLPDTKPVKTDSKVTKASKHVASITPRYKSQNAVMNDIGAPSVGICYFFRII